MLVMTWSRKWIVLVLAVLATIGLCACGSNQGSNSGKKVVFVSHDEATNFAGKLYQGVSDRANKLGIEVEYMNAKMDANLQIDQMNEAIAQKPAAIILLAVEGSALIPSVEKANEAGIPVIAGEEGICKGCGIATLSIDYYSLGYKAGEMAYEILVNDADPATMEIEYASDLTNKYVADRCEALNIKVPDSYEAIEME